MAMLAFAFTTSTAVLAQEYDMPETEIEDEVCYDSLGEKMPCPTDMQQEEDTTDESDMISVEDDTTEYDDEY
jgi:hypothetical protein